MNDQIKQQYDDLKKMGGVKVNLLYKQYFDKLKDLVNEYKTFSNIETGEKIIKFSLLILKIFLRK